MLMAARAFSGMDLLWKRIMAGDAGNYVQQLIDDNSPFYAGDGKITLSEPGNFNLTQPAPDTASWVTIQRYPTTDAHWRVDNFIYLPAEKSDGTTNIYCWCVDDIDRARAGIGIVQAWPDDQAEKYTAGNGGVDFYMAGSHGDGGGSSFDPTKGQVGPYSIFVSDGKSGTDIVHGLGLPLNRHVNYLIWFKYVPAGSKPVDPPKPPDTTPATIEDATKLAALSVDWMPINDGAALYKYAERNGLGQPQTDEIQYIYRGVQYVCQVFNLGIVYCKVNDWVNIKVVSK